MIMLKKDASLDNVFWWRPPTGFTWVDFHQAVDDIKKLGAEIHHPITIVVHPQGDLPRGNAIPHLGRLFNLLKTSDAIQCFVIILDSQHPVSQMLMPIISQVYGVPSKFVMVQSLEQALVEIGNNN